MPKSDRASQEEKSDSTWPVCLMKETSISHHGITGDQPEQLGEREMVEEEGLYWEAVECWLENK